MAKPDKVYTLTIVFNEEKEEIEYLEETISVENTNEPASVLVDFSEYWDEESMKLLKNVYFLAEA
tara:strand:+ start:288 stop:482 length:195 start_codon:yes stop_codon:yes gene_type:complete